MITSGTIGSDGHTIILAGNGTTNLANETLSLIGNANVSNPVMLVSGSTLTATGLIVPGITVQLVDSGSNNTPGTLTLTNNSTVPDTITGITATLSGLDVLTWFPTPTYAGPFISTASSEVPTLVYAGTAPAFGDTGTISIYLTDTSSALIARGSFTIPNTISGVTPALTLTGPAIAIVGTPVTLTWSTNSTNGPFTLTANGTGETWTPDNATAGMLVTATQGTLAFTQTLMATTTLTVNGTDGSQSFTSGTANLTPLNYTISGVSAAVSGSYIRVAWTDDGNPARLFWTVQNGTDEEFIVGHPYSTVEFANDNATHSFTVRAYDAVSNIAGISVPYLFIPTIPTLTLTGPASAVVGTPVTFTVTTNNTTGNFTLTGNGTGGDWTPTNVTAGILVIGTQQTLIFTQTVMGVTTLTVNGTNSNESFTGATANLTALNYTISGVSASYMTQAGVTGMFVSWTDNNPARYESSIEMDGGGEAFVGGYTSIGFGGATNATHSFVIRAYDLNDTLAGISLPYLFIPTITGITAVRDGADVVVTIPVVTSDHATISVNGADENLITGTVYRIPGGASATQRVWVRWYDAGGNVIAQGTVAYRLNRGNAGVLLALDVIEMS